MRIAVIGIGSNSVRMLGACLERGQVIPVLRDRAGTRLFGGLDARGNLTPESIAATVRTICAMQKKALEWGAENVHVFATSAVRDAENQAEFCRQVFMETGMELEVCSGESEAALSFLGSWEQGRCGMIDIGGGSTEIAVGQGRQIEHSVSLQMGAVRLYRLIPIQDESGIGQVMAAATHILKGGMDGFKRIAAPDKWIGVGGTFTALASLVMDKPWSDRSQTHGAQITREAAMAFARQLANMTLEERIAHKGLQPHRADIAVHGICILLACMEELQIPVIRVSTCGNVDGYIKHLYGMGI